LPLADNVVRDPSFGARRSINVTIHSAGVPVQMVTYPRDNHGPLSRDITGAPSPEPWHGFDARQRIVKFFERAFDR